MACGCRPSIYNPQPVNPCEDCLIVNSLIIGCDDAPNPCGDSFTINLADYNDLSACKDCVPTYSLISAESPGVSASINAAGVLTVTTGAWFEYNKLWKVTYKVDCPCSILSATATVYVCMKNPCTSGCFDNCNPCDGSCLVTPDITVNAASSLAACGDDIDIDITTGFTLAACDTGSVEYEVVSYSSAFTSATINASGILSLVSSNGAVPNNYYPVVVKVKCPAYGIDNLVTVSVGIKDLCEGVVCGDGTVCEKCTGNCIPEGDIDISITI